MTSGQRFSPGTTASGSVSLECANSIPTPVATSYPQTLQNGSLTLPNFGTIQNLVINYYGDSK